MPQTSLPTVAQSNQPLAASQHERHRRGRELGLRLIHAVVIGLSTAAAWGLGVALTGRWLESANFATALWVLIAAKMIASELFRLHRASWRWFGLADAAAITLSNTCGSVLGALILGPRVAVPTMAAILVIEWLVSQAALLGSRTLFRSIKETPDRSLALRSKRILIYGAGRRGVNLLRQIRANPCSPYEIAGFVDDDPRKRHMTIQMHPVLGDGEELPRLARSHDVDEILVAVGSSDRESRNRIRKLSRMAGLGCRFPRLRQAEDRNRSPQTATAPEGLSNGRSGPPAPGPR